MHATLEYTLEVRQLGSITEVLSVSKHIAQEKNGVIFLPLIFRVPTKDLLDTHGSTLFAIAAMIKRTASVTSQGGLPSFRVEYN